MSNLPVLVPQSQAMTFSYNYLQTAGAMSDPSGDFITCPIGLLMLLSTLLGSRAPGGSTARQISKTLGFGGTTSGLQASAMATNLYKTISESLEKETSETEDGIINNVQMADALMLRRGYVVQRAFLNNLAQFDAALFEIDFTNPSSAVKQINTWVDKKSNGLIPELFTSPDEIDPATRMMLMNVFVFKDNWMTTFGESEPGTFFTGPNSPISIPMMSGSERMSVVQDTALGYTAVKKPMRNARFSFILVLPDKRFNTAAVNRVLFKTKSVKALFEKSTIYDVQLTMPKFSLDMNLDLKPVAQKMGIVDLFSDRRADLSGITTSERLFVTALKQASVLRVDEYGVEAAAATYMSFGTTSLIETLTFNVDQPFGCMIYDEQLDLPLFVARVHNPQQ